jgi:hypothetical protein
VYYQSTPRQLTAAVHRSMLTDLFMILTQHFARMFNSLLPQLFGTAWTRSWCKKGILWECTRYTSCARAVIRGAKFMCFLRNANGPTKVTLFEHNLELKLSQYHRASAENIALVYNLALGEPATAIPNSSRLQHDLHGTLVLDSLFLHALLRDKTVRRQLLHLPHQAISDFDITQH